MVMYPAGHARNEDADLEGILKNKFEQLGDLCLEKEEFGQVLERLNNLDNLTNWDLKHLYSCNIKYADKSIDE